MKLLSLRDLNRNCITERLTGGSALSAKRFELSAAGAPPAPGDISLPSIETLLDSMIPACGIKRYTPADFIADALFYAALFIIVLSVLIYGDNKGAPKVIMGYSYYTVLSGSMQEEIPVNSLILVRQVRPGELAIGDNITFMSGPSKTVTHKIIDIYRNFEDSGERGYKTKGTSNSRPDDEVVYESNVVGKVVLVMPDAGKFVRGVLANMHLVYIIIGLCVIFSFCIRGIFTRPHSNFKI